MKIPRKALYNLLRQNWCLDQSAELLPWQIEDYRNLPLEKIFQRLAKLDLPFNSASFLAFAEQSQSPEDLTDQVVYEGVDSYAKDQIYLLLFELWRRIAPHRACLSIFCDELDYQIDLYDQGEMCIELQNRIIELQKLLEENVDEGLTPFEVFRAICQGCANNIEIFLYDYICEQLEECSFTYAADLIEGFYPYVADAKWFALLHARLTLEIDSTCSEDIFEQFFTEKLDVEFCLELLHYMLQEKRCRFFLSLVKQTVHLLEVEEDFVELLKLYKEFLTISDCKEEGQLVQLILKNREKKETHFTHQDHHVKELLQLLARRSI